MDEWILSRLFIALPELGTDDRFLAQLIAKGVIPSEVIAIYKEVRKGFPGLKAPKGQPLLQRLMMIAPELMSVRLMQVLKSMRLISAKDANALSVLLKAGSRLLPGGVSEATMWTRMGAVFDDIFSPATVNYIRALNNEQIAALRQILRAVPENFGPREGIFGYRYGTLTSGDAEIIRNLLAKSVARAQVLRAVISGTRRIRADLKTRDLDTVWDVLGLAFDNILDEGTLRNLVRAGVISPERFAMFDSLRALGAGVWRKAVLAHTYEGWAARTLLMSEGVLSHETVKVLLALGRITPAQAELLYPVMSVIRGITRQAASKWRTGQRYRIVPGEKPIKTFARMSQQTDRALLSLLSQAADDARREAERLAATKAFGNLTRGRQQAAVAGAVHRSMRDVMENVGSLVIFGEKEAAQAALEAYTFMAKPYGASAEGKALQRMLRYTAQSGVDSYISREENILPLSRRVYRNISLLNGQVDREISKGLIRGLNARELAGVVQRFIHPGTPGGASYAAMRLARTEINNAFHQTAIRYTREMPWVEGYRWNLSGSHGRPDVCNDMAEHSEGLGRGVYGKAGAPGKPHPHCLCYITTESVDNATFYKRYRSGAYSSYLDQIQGAGVFPEDRYTPTRVQDVARSGANLALVNILADVVGRVGQLLLR